MHPTEIILIRHGETVANASGTVQGQLDVELNATGIRQAGRLAERLRDIPLDAVYASDLSRAMHTARIVAEPHKLDAIPSPEFREWHLGEWQGRRIADILTLFPGEFEGFVHDSLTMTVTGGELRSAFQRRVSDAIDLLAARHSGGRIAIVSHGAALGMILKHILNAENIPFPRRPKTSNASYSKVIHFEDGTWQLLTWNDTSHLDNLGSELGKW